MHNFCLRLYFVCALIFSGFAHGQNSIVTPIAITNATIDQTGNVRAMTTYRAQFAGQPDSYYSRAVAYNKATTGKLGRARAFVNGNAAQIGVIAATLAIGYALDEITKDVYSSLPVAQAPITDLSKPIYRAFVNGVYYYGTDLDSLLTTAVNKWGNGSPVSAVYMTQGMYCKNTSEGLTMCAQQYGAVPYIDGVNSVNANPTSAGVKATDEQLHDAMFPPPLWNKNGYLGDALPDLLRDPVTGAVENTQEVQNTATEIQNEHNKLFNPSATPVSPPAVDPNYATTTNNQASTGLPAFCGWASSVCDFINWFKTDTTTEPTTTALPQSQLTYETPTWSSGLGSGSCPAPQSFSVLGGTFEVSYDPWCELAGLIKYLVLALAYISSALIISGVRR